MADEIKVDAQTLQAKVNLQVPVNMPSRYAHHMVVQDDGADMLLLFFETTTPFLPFSKDEREKAIKDMQTDGIPAHCIAKIRVGKHKMPGFTEVLNSVTARIEEEMKLIGEEYGLDSRNDSKN